MLLQKVKILKILNKNIVCPGRFCVASGIQIRTSIVGSNVYVTSILCRPSILAVRWFLIVDWLSLFEKTEFRLIWLDVRFCEETSSFYHHTHGTGSGMGNGSMTFLPLCRRRAAKAALLNIFFLPASTLFCCKLSKENNRTKLIKAA